MGGGISWILGAVASIFSSIAAPLAMFIDGIFGTTILKDVLGPIFKFLGFEDEDTYTASVQTIRIYDDDTLNEVRKQLHLEYMKEGTGSLIYAKHYARTGDAQFGKYYRYGEWEYTDHLPTAYINATTYDRAAIERAVASYYGSSDIYVNDISARVPRDDEWAKWKLQEAYGYNYGVDTFKYSDGKWYRFISATYNESTNRTTIAIEVIPTIKTTVSTLTNTEVTPYSDTQDKVTVTEEVTTILQGALADSSKLDLSLTTVVNPSQISYIPKNTQTSNTQVNSVDLPDTTQTSNTTSIVIDSFSVATTYFIIDFVIAGTTAHQFLICDVANNPYNLGTPYAHTGVQKLYPIVMLRNHTFNLNQYNESTHILHGQGANDTLYRPSRVNEERYESSKKLLDKIGVDLDQLLDQLSQNPDLEKVFDAFFMVGVSPSESDPVVSRYLYEMLDSIIDSYPYGEGTVAAFACSFTEDPYNLVVSWEGGSNEILDGTITYIGDCTHGIRDEEWISDIYEVVEWLDYYVTYSGEDENTGVYYEHTYQACYYTAYQRHYDWKGRIFKSVVAISKRIANEGQLNTIYTNTVVTNENSDLDVEEIEDETASYSRYKLVGEPEGEWSYHPSSNRPNYWNMRTGTSTRITQYKTEVKKALYIKKQLTADTYRDVSIHGVKAVTIVKGGSAEVLGNFSIGCEIELDSPNLTFPLSVDIVARLTLMEKTALLGKAFHLTFYAANHTHLEWYQTEAFANFIQTLMIGITIIITIVVTIFTFGSGTWASLTLTQILTRLATMALIAAGTFVALQLIDTLVQDPMLKAMLSMAVMVAATFASMGAAGSSFSWTTAVELGGVCVKAADIYTKSLLDQQQAKLKKLQNQYSDFMKEYEERLSPIKDYEESQKGQLSTGFFTSLTVGSGQDTNESGMSESLNLSPSSFFYIATNQAAYDYDLLFTGVYDNTVHKFVANKLTLGLV